MYPNTSKIIELKFNVFTDVWCYTEYKFVTSPPFIAVHTGDRNGMEVTSILHSVAPKTKRDISAMHEKTGERFDLANKVFCIALIVTFRLDSCEIMPSLRHRLKNGVPRPIISFALSEWSFCGTPASWTKQVRVSPRYS